MKIGEPTGVKALVIYGVSGRGRKWWSENGIIDIEIKNFFGKKDIVYLSIFNNTLSLNQKVNI